MQGESEKTMKLDIVLAKIATKNYTAIILNSDNIDDAITSIVEFFDYIDSKNISKSVADYLKMKITVLMAANGYLPSYSCKMFGFKRSRRYNGGTDM